MAKLYSPFRFLRIVFCGAGLLFAAGTAQAQDPSLFTVENVKVDVTAESAVTARNQAFEKAQQEAFTQLASRFLPEDNMTGFTPPEALAISPMIQDFEITEEHLSKIRYVGTYTFRFNESAVNSYFKRSGVAYTTVTSKPVLILPFYQWGSRTILWDGENPWLASWTRAGSYSSGLVPVTLPIGDVQDIADMGDQDALIYEADALNAMLIRYNAGSAVIAIAAPAWSGAADETGIPDAVAVTLYRAEPAGPRYIQTIKIGRSESEDASALYGKAVTEVRRSLQKDWQTRAAVDPVQAAGSGKLLAKVGFQAMNEWIETQRALRGTPGVSDIKLISLTSHEARLEIMYEGTEDRLRLALAQSNLTLSAPANDNFLQQANPYMAPDPHGAPPPAGSGIYDLRLSRFAPGGTY